MKVIAVVKGNGIENVVEAEDVTKLEAFAMVGLLQKIQQRILEQIETDAHYEKEPKGKQND